MIDARGQSEESFQRIRYVGFNILWRHAREERSHHHFRQVDLRKQIDGHPRQAGHADDEQHQADDNYEIRIANGKPWHKLVRFNLAKPPFARRCHLLIILLVVLHDRDFLGMHFLSRLQAAPVADDDLFAIR